MILHYSSYTVEFIKTPSLMLTIILLGISGYKYAYLFRNSIIILFLIAVNYIIINDIYFHSYILKSILYAFICGAVFKMPKLVFRFMHVNMIVGGVLATQALILIIFWAIDYQLSYDSVIFIDSNSHRYFNFMFGFGNDYNYFRLTSYFTESNRFAYFLTPALFVSFYFMQTTQKYIYKYVFSVIAVSIAFTFSVFGFFSILSGVFLYYIYYRNISIKTIIYYGVVLVTLVTIYNIFSDYYDFMFNKSGSYLDRYTGILSKISTVKSHPWGLPEKTISYVTTAKYYGNSTLTILNWAVSGGLQSAALLILLLFSWIKSIHSLLTSKNHFMIIIGCATFALLLEQSFYGTYYEYYFLSVMAIVTVLQYMVKRDDLRLYTLLNQSPK